VTDRQADRQREGRTGDSIQRAKHICYMLSRAKKTIHEQNVAVQEFQGQDFLSDHRTASLGFISLYCPSKKSLYLFDEGGGSCKRTLKSLF